MNPEYNIYRIYICRERAAGPPTCCSAVRTFTQCFAASYARVTCEFLHGLRLRRRCRTDIYTISRGSSGVLANLIRLKRQIFVCLLPLARCVAEGGMGRMLNTRRCVGKRYNALYCDSTRPDQFVCLELDNKLIACRGSPPLSTLLPPPSLGSHLNYQQVPSPFGRFKAITANALSSGQHNSITTNLL